MAFYCTMYQVGEERAAGGNSKLSEEGTSADAPAMTYCNGAA